MIGYVTTEVPGGGVGRIPDLAVDGAWQGGVGRRLLDQALAHLPGAGPSPGQDRDPVPQRGRAPPLPLAGVASWWRRSFHCVMPSKPVPIRGRRNAEVRVETDPRFWPGARPGPEAGTGPGPPAASPDDALHRHAPGAHRPFGLTVSVLLLALGLCAASGVLAALAFHDRVLPGVQALGLDLGRPAPPGAGQRLGDRVDALLGQRPVLAPRRAGGRPPAPAPSASATPSPEGSWSEPWKWAGTPLAGMTVAGARPPEGAPRLPAAPVDLAPLPGRPRRAGRGVGPTPQRRPRPAAGRWRA